jgi:hypothetical protein
VRSRSDRETVDVSELVEDDDKAILLYMPELCRYHATVSRSLCVPAPSQVYVMGARKSGWARLVVPGGWRASWWSRRG